MKASSSLAQPARGPCGDTYPNCRELLTPVHDFGLAGGRKRFAPAVVSPYGIPLNVEIPLCTYPATFPAPVETIASFDDAISGLCPVAFSVSVVDMLAANDGIA